MTNYPLNIAASATLSINTQASFVYYESASAGGADTSIRLVTDTGDEFILKVGQGARLKKDFHSLYVSNVNGQGTIIGNLVLSDGDFVDHRVVGSVNVLDGSKALTKSGTAFSAAIGAPAAVATFYSRIAIWNPIGSGISSIIESLLMTSPSALAVNIAFITAALGTARGVGNSKFSGLSSSLSLLNADSDVASTTQSTAQPGKTPLWSMSVLANGTISWEPKEPIVLVPGVGLVIWANTANIGFAGCFEWYEEPL